MDGFAVYVVLAALAILTITIFTVPCLDWATGVCAGSTVHGSSVIDAFYGADTPTVPMGTHGQTNSISDTIEERRETLRHVRQSSFTRQHHHEGQKGSKHSASGTTNHQSKDSRVGHFNRKLGDIQTHWNINPWSEITVAITKCMLGMVVEILVHSADKPTVSDKGSPGKYSKLFKHRILSLPVDNHSLKYP